VLTVLDWIDKNKDSEPSMYDFKDEMGVVLTVLDWIDKNKDSEPSIYEFKDKMGVVFTVLDWIDKNKDSEPSMYMLKDKNCFVTVLEWINVIEDIDEDRDGESDEDSDEDNESDNTVQTKINMTNNQCTLIANNSRANGPISLYFSEKSSRLTGAVRDENGNTVFKIKVKGWTLSNRRSLLDSNGNPMGEARRRKMPGKLNEYYLGPLNDEKRLVVKLKGKLICDAEISMGGNVIGKAHGNWEAKTIKITLFDNVVATMDSKRASFLGKDRYCVEVKEGVDTAFIALLIMCIHGLYND